MSSAAPSHRRGKAVDDAILDAVLRVVADTGSLSVRVDDVADRAGVNKTTVYRRYASAEELVLAALLRNAASGVPMPDSGSLHEDLTALVRMVRDALTAPIGVALLRAAGGGAFDELRQRYWSERLELAADLLRRGAERGECGPVLDAQERIEALVAPIHFRIVQRSGVADDAFLDALVERTLADLPRAAGAVACASASSE